MSELVDGQSIQGTTDTYTVERELAKGGFGTTYLATSSSGQVVAVKTLHTARLSDWKSFELFEREIKILRRLDHPRIPNYVDDAKLGDDASSGLALVQEFVDGYSLSEVVSGERSMDEGKLVRWFAEVLEVLVYLHGQTPPVIHRDITPKNILIRHEDGVPYLVDFGTVQAAIRSATEVSSTSAGTFGYAPMEQFVGSAFPASDLYALGITVLAVASGKEPADMSFSGIRVDIPKELGLDARLRLLLERMTEPDPDRRLADARIALEQLRPLRARYGADRGASPDAMQALAAKQGVSTSPARPRVSGDDLLASERIREAARRLKQLGDDALGIPYLAPRAQDLETRSYAASGGYLSVDHLILSTDSMEVAFSVPRKHGIMAMTTAADRVLTYERDSHRMDVATVHTRESGADQFVRGSQVQVSAEYSLPIFSPDGLFIAAPERGLIDDGPLNLFDANTGEKVQTIAGKYRLAAYSADGKSLACIKESMARLMNQDGSEQSFYSQALAFAPDGRSLAVLTEKTLLVGPPSDQREVLKLSNRGSTWHQSVISPDGRYFAAHSYSEDRICVFDLVSQAELPPLIDPHKPKERVRDVSALAFSADGTRLFVSCSIHYGRYDDADKDCVAIWAIPSGRYLGAILREDEEPVMVAANGFYGRVGKPHPTGDPWNRPEVARAALCGQDTNEVLGELERAQLADIEARWAFFHDRRERRTIETEAEIHTMMHAARGLTHLLDEVVSRARAAQRARPSFGGGTQEACLTMDQVITSCKELKKLDPEELDVICEERIAKSEAQEAEQARAAALAPQVPEAMVPTKPQGQGGAALQTEASKGALEEATKQAAIRTINRKTAFVVGSIFAWLGLLLWLILTFAT